MTPADDFSRVTGDFPTAKEHATDECSVFIRLKHRVIMPEAKIAMTTNTKTIELSEEWDSLPCLF